MGEETAMRFESRELKSYAEPVSVSDLRAHEVYFSVQFMDEKLLVPILLPLIFLGKNLSEGDTDLFYFQDYESYSTGSRYHADSGNDAAAFHVRGPGDMNHIFNYERALDLLLNCSLRRQDVQKGSRQ